MDRLGVVFDPSWAGFTATGLPFGAQLVGHQDTDEVMAPFAHALHAAARTGAGLDRSLVLPPVARPAEDRIAIVVVGAHLSGMPRNGELTRLGAVLVQETATAPGCRAKP